MNKIRNWFQRSRLLRRQLVRLFYVTAGSFIAAGGYVFFQLPFNTASGGLSGVAIIINHFTAWPVGSLYWVMNIPMVMLGFRYLGRWPFVWRTITAVTLFSFFTDFLSFTFPQLISHQPITDNILLATIYAGIISGIGTGLIFRAGGTLGGTSITGRIIQRRYGIPLSQSFLVTDTVIILALGLVFGWEITLYGFLMLLITGMTSDIILEGVSSTRTATIITDHPQEMSAALIARLGRGATYWEVTGGFTGRSRYLVTCTMYRSQMADVRDIVADVDPQAFVTIGVSHHAMGQGFAPLGDQLPGAKKPVTAKNEDPD